MSYSTYLRNKADAQPRIMSLHKPTDASQHTHKKRLESTQVFFADGQGVGSLAMDTTRPDGTPLLQHPSTSSRKKSLRPADASDYTSFRGHIGIGDDSKYLKGEDKVVIEGCCNVSTSSLSSTFIARAFAETSIGEDTFIIVVGEDTTHSGKTIYRSSDYGVSWSPVTIGESATSFLRAGYGVAAIPNTSNVVAVGTYDVGHNTSILCSTDGGQTWIGGQTSGYFSVAGHGIVYDPNSESESGFLMVGDDGSGGNHIKYFNSFSDVQDGDVGIEINSTLGGISASGKGWGVATDGAGQFVVVGEDYGFNTIFYNTTIGVLDSWSSNVGSAFAVAGYGVAVDDSGNWVMVGDDGGQYNIKYFENNSFTSCTSVMSNTFTSYGTSVISYGNNWFLTGAGEITYKVAFSFSDIINGIFLESGSPLETGYAFYGGGAGIIGGKDVYPVKYLTHTGFENSTGLPVGRSGSSTSSTTPKYTSASDFMRSKTCAITCEEKHRSDELGEPKFVDNTIRLSAMHPEMVAAGGCCTDSMTQANHTHSEGIHPPVRPIAANGKRSLFTVAPPEFQNQGIGGRRSGAYYTPKSGYVEKKHGNDLSVNPKRVPVPFILDGNAPAHLKINKPTLFNIKSF